MAYKIPNTYLKFYSMNSCVIQEIEGLTYYSHPSDSNRNGKAALADFCQQTLEMKVTKFKTLQAPDKKLYSHYVFCAGLYRQLGVAANYGAIFADAIREAKAGVVVEAPVKENEAYHPGRDGQAWIWCPDTEALIKWWEAWKIENAIPEAPVTPITPYEPPVSEVVKAEAPINVAQAAYIQGWARLIQEENQEIAQRERAKLKRYYDKGGW